MKFILLFFCLLMFSCEKAPTCDCQVPYQVYYFKARVIQTNDISCYKPVLDFSEDSLRIRDLTNSKDLVYSVINLPEQYIIQGQALYVMVETLKEEEEFPCNALGLSRPHLDVKDAKER